MNNMRGVLSGNLKQECPTQNYKLEGVLPKKGELFMKIKFEYHPEDKENIRGIP